MKSCSKCKNIRDLSEFSKDRSSKDGLRSQCKSCQKLYRQSVSDKQRDYRIKNKEAISSKWKEDYYSDKTKKRLRDKEYYQINKENWMNWSNRGLYNGSENYGWDIDHINPISSAEKLEDVIKLNHYTNLQSLCSKINRDIKKNKICQVIIH